MMKACLDESVVRLISMECALAYSIGARPWGLNVIPSLHDQYNVCGLKVKQIRRK